jgi:hypothetical protein
MALTGTALAPTRDVGSLRLTWWRQPWVRFAVGVLAFAGLFALVPIYGPMVAALVLTRLIALPRRDWTPREDELPRVVRIPGGRGAYVLEQTFGEAEALRTEWCRNPEHSHPYASWHEARTYFCRHDTND